MFWKLKCDYYFVGSKLLITGPSELGAPCPHRHMNTLIQELFIAAVVVDVVGINVPLHHLQQIVFKVFLEANGFIQLNLVTFKPLPSGYDN